MMKAGPAKKVSIYFGQDHQYHGESVYAAILEFLFYHKVSGASVTRGIAGFGADQHMHTDRILVLSEYLPMKFEFIETPEKVEENLPKLYDMAGTGLIQIQDTTIVKPSEFKQAARQESTSPLKTRGKSQVDAGSSSAKTINRMASPSTKHSLIHSHQRYLRCHCLSRYSGPRSQSQDSQGFSAASFA